MKKSLLILVAIAGLAISGTAFAREAELRGRENEAELRGRENEVESHKEGRVDLQKQKEELVAQRCANVQGRLGERMGNFDGHKEKHMAVYANMTDRISKFIEKLSAEGYDTAKVKADLEVLKTKIAKFSADKEARLAKLNETKSFACGKSDGEFRGKLTEARAALQLVHADAMDIRKYMLSTVRPDIQALRNQKVETKKINDAAKTGAPELE